MECYASMCQYCKSRVDCCRVVAYGAMLVSQSFSTLFGILSGPFAFFGLTLLSSLFTPSSNISKWLMSGDGLPFNSGLFVIFSFVKRIYIVGFVPLPFFYCLP